MRNNNMFSWRNKKKKYYLDIPLLDLELCISNLKMAKIRMNIIVYKPIISRSSVIYSQYYLEEDNAHFLLHHENMPI